MSEPSPAGPGRMIALLEVAGHRSSPHERQAFLDSLDDAAVRAQVESLLELQDAERTQTIDRPEASISSGSARVEVPFEGTARFEPTAVLGTGGFGTVCRVFDRGRNTNAALKVMRERNPQVLY